MDGSFSPTMVVRNCRLKDGEMEEGDGRVLKKKPIVHRRRQKMASRERSHRGWGVVRVV